MKIIEIKGIDSNYELKKGDILLIPKYKNPQESGIVISGTNGIKEYHYNHFELCGKVKYYDIPIYSNHHIEIAPKDFKILENKPKNYNKINPSLKINVVEQSINTNNDVEKLIIKDKRGLIFTCFSDRFYELTLMEYLHICIKNNSMKLQIEIC